MAKNYGYPLGFYRDRKFSIEVRVSPSFATVDDFAVTVYYTRPDGTGVPVARVDQAHGYTHFDRLYRRDQPKDPIDWDYIEAEEELSTNWRRYAESYADAHGL